ncbi:MAG TPA: thiol peroxidase [Fusobacteriaceae bacterium]|mgnify:CR=1 FL=1|nr:thiol peroxidase [Fusobacteriaceae bacterium]
MEVFRLINNITFGGNPLTLVGNEIKVGAVAPNFTALKTDLSPFSLEELKGKVVIISVVPSVDTPVCELQTIRFNTEAYEHGDINVITISADLPFALGKFCANKGIDTAITLSDHKGLDFGMKYGFILDELRLLSRGIIVIGKDGIVKYVEYVQEVTNHPDYDKAMDIAKELV